MSIQIAAIGLGRMGAALAATLLQNNYKVIVWNRTASKAAPLLNDGAIEATTASTNTEFMPRTAAANTIKPSTNILVDIT